MTPEEKARVKIDQWFADAGWKVVNRDEYAPVCDEIPIEVAMANGWVSQYKDYVVIIEVPDIQTYKEYNREFVEHFEFFGFSWPTVMSLVGKDGFKKRKEYTNQICKNPNEWKNVFKQVTYHSVGLMRTLKLRKAFIANHPDKIRIARKIIAARKESSFLSLSVTVIFIFVPPYLPAPSAIQQTT